MLKLKILLVAGIAVFIIAPFIHYIVFGEYPEGFPIQTQNKQTVNALNRINGFTPLYYEKSEPPDLAKLAGWGANAVTIVAEDMEGFAEQNRILKENGIDAIIPVPDLPPPDLEIEKEVENLIFKAKSMGLAVNLAMPVTEKWLEKAENWKVEMILVNGESDAWVPDRMAPEDVNMVNSVLLKESRKHYSGLIGTGFTNLIDRMDPLTQKESPHVKYINVSGFDFITINPHPDPSMKPERLLTYAENTARSARGIADRNGIKKVLLGAIMVRSKSEKIKGFTNVEGYAYTEEEERDFYAALFERTGNLLDGYFLDFSGREERPVVEVISRYYGMGK